MIVLCMFIKVLPNVQLPLQSILIPALGHILVTFIRFTIILVYFTKIYINLRQVKKLKTDFFFSKTVDTTQFRFFHMEEDACKSSAVW